MRDRVHARKVRAPRTALTWIVGLSCASMALIALALSTWYFAGFWENDRGTWHLLQAGLLSFGVGSLAWGAYGWTAWIALMSRTRKVLVCILMGPWIVVGGYWVVATALDPLPGLLVAGIAGLAVFWALSLPRGNDSQPN